MYDRDALAEVKEQFESLNLNIKMEQSLKVLYTFIENSILLFSSKNKNSTIESKNSKIVFHQPPVIIQRPTHKSSKSKDLSSLQTSVSLQKPTQTPTPSVLPTDLPRPVTRINPKTAQENQDPKKASLAPSPIKRIPLLQMDKIQNIVELDQRLIEQDSARG